jgi:outer membrane receptor protein involved in Fe transport
MNPKSNNGGRIGAPLNLSHLKHSAAPAAPSLHDLGARLGRNALAVAVAGALYCSSAASVHAADAAEAPVGDSQNLQEIVVTASAVAVKKLDASFNIVSANLDEIQLSNPGSAAEIYKLSPGVWPEASGGQTGVNIDIAGFPNGGGDSPYFTTMIQGLPLYGSPDLSFMDNSTLVRFDDTVERVEIVQGGTSAIYGPGQAGATANFILRTGSDKTEGSIGATYGSEGSERLDAFLSGKITDGWYGSIGGFYRDSDGVRDPQYPSDIGGQLTATLKHTMDNGFVMAWFRTLQDKNQWVADFPYSLSANGTVSPYPGFNQLDSTYNSKQLQNFQVPNPACRCFENDDISDGRGANMNYFGINLELKFDGGLTLTNNFLFDGGNVNTHALVNNGNPTSLGAFITGLADPTTGTLPGTNITPGMVQANYLNGQAADLGQSVVTQQVWDVQKKITSVTDELRFTEDFGPVLFGTDDALTFGAYFAHYTDNDNWELGSNVLIQNVPNASPIVLSAVSGGNAYEVSSPQGIYNANGSYNILEQGSATNVAVYLSNDWKFDKLIVNLAARLEHIDLTQQTTNLSPYQLGSQYDLWDNAVNLPNGTYSYASEINTMPTFSFGANYEFTDNFSGYVRVNNGVFFDNFDAVRCNTSAAVNERCNSNPPLTTVRNYEGGIKLQNQYTYIDASVYHKTFAGLEYQPVNIENEVLAPPSYYGSTSTGVRLIGSVSPLAGMDMQPLRDFKITVNADYEKAHYKDYVGCYIYQDVNGNTICGDINNSQLARLPNFQIRVTPSDTQTLNWGSVTEYVTYEHIGNRYQDPTNDTPLYAYYDLAAGISAQVGDNWQFRLLGSNLTNQIGLTEGNARLGGNTVQNGVGFGRSILGREVNVSVKYKF